MFLIDHLLHRENVTQYTVGFFGTGATSFLAGADTITSGVAATVIPALVMLLVNLPKLIRESIALYKNLKNDDGKDQKDPQ